MCYWSSVYIRQRIKDSQTDGQTEGNRYNFSIDLVRPFRFQLIRFPRLKHGRLQWNHHFAALNSLKAEKRWFCREADGLKIISFLYFLLFPTFSTKRALSAQAQTNVAILKIPVAFNAFLIWIFFLTFFFYKNVLLFD